MNKYNLKLLCPFLNYITNPPGLPIEQVCFHINQSSNLIKLSFVHLLQLKKYFHFRKKLRPCFLLMQSFISFLFYCSRPPTFYKPDKKKLFTSLLISFAFHQHILDPGIKINQQHFYLLSGCSFNAPNVSFRKFDATNFFNCLKL